VDEHVFFGVIPVDEAVAGLHVEPLNSAAHFSGDHLLGWLLLHGLIISSLLLGGLGLRVSHDVNVVLMVTNFSPRLFSKMAAISVTFIR